MCQNILFLFSFDNILLTIHSNSIFLTILFSHAFSSFFIIDLYFLIPAVIAKIFIPTTELVIPTDKKK